MTNRHKKPDTAADLRLYQCLATEPPTSFLMTAGAGSGKTTSLIKALRKIVELNGERLARRRQKVACITYTEIAVGEIAEDVGHDTLVHVSTIHSFLWTLIRNFQVDIRTWVEQRIDEKLADLRQAAAAFGPRVQQRTRDKNARDIARWEQQRGRISRVQSFRYGTGSDYANGILGHDDIIKMVPQLTSERQLMRRLIAQQYPFLFVDESQDTMENVVAALKAVDLEFGEQFCLGFFGDPMQQIYQTGIGTIAREDGWESITKPENFRCPLAVLRVANAIRHDGDGLEQVRGRTEIRDGIEVPVKGSAHFFAFPNGQAREASIQSVKNSMARLSTNPTWLELEKVKILVIVHRMAANRLGFGTLYEALNDESPERFKNGFIDGTAWPLQPFRRFIVPLVTAADQHDEFEVIQLFKVLSPLLASEGLRGAEVAERLASCRRFTEELQVMMGNGGATVAEVLHLVHDRNAYPLDPRLLGYLKLPVPETEPDEEHEYREEDADELSKEITSMDAFLRCPANQLRGYVEYLSNASPFSTQHGIKGTEFERVLVVLDDEEGTHKQFSYDKYLGLKELSDRDEENIREGRDNVVARTRRLFYVCCTRAQTDLAVVLFTDDVEAAREQVTAQELFPPECVHLPGNLHD
ncbi:MAG: UvrD-helicase domain-containing protein [Pirellulales bacterium]